MVIPKQGAITITAGTPIALSTLVSTLENVRLRGWLIQAKSTNAGTVVVGSSAVTTSNAPGLTASGTLGSMPDGTSDMRPEDWFVDGSVNGDIALVLLWVKV